LNGKWQGFHISYMCFLWQDLSIGTNFFDFVTLKFDPLFKNFNIGYIFWMASGKVFIFLMCVLYDKTFLLVPAGLEIMREILANCELFAKIASKINGHTQNFASGDFQHLYPFFFRVFHKSFLH
jgi:hypothetical protein